VRVQEARLRRDATYQPTHLPELLGGVTVVEADATARPAGDWQGRLYRPLESNESKQTRLRLIPYYAWSNRGASEMTVWMPIE
jgi:DUF1680 family protein